MFSISVASAGGVLTADEGANCESTGFPGCMVGTFGATIDSLQVEQLTFMGGSATVRDPTFDLGADPLGISWTVRMRSVYPFDCGDGPLVFVPEPSTGLLLASGLVGLAARRRTRAR